MVRQCESDNYAKNAASDRFGGLPAINVGDYEPKSTALQHESTPTHYHMQYKLERTLPQDVIHE